MTLAQPLATDHECPSPSAYAWVTSDWTAALRYVSTAKTQRARNPPWRSTANPIGLWLRQIGASREQWLFSDRADGPMKRTRVTERLNLATHSRGSKPGASHPLGSTRDCHASAPVTFVCRSSRCGWATRRIQRPRGFYVEPNLAMKDGAIQVPQSKHTATARQIACYSINSM